MSDTPPPHILKVAKLATRKPTRFELRPPPVIRAQIAQELGLIALPKLRMRGEITPNGARDFTLRAELEASVTQACVITLDPVSSIIRESVTRIYKADWEAPKGDEIELRDDENIDPLPEEIDLGAVAQEALALALPLYPRSASAALPEASPDTDQNDTRKPFAALAAQLGMKTPPQE